MSKTPKRPSLSPKLKARDTLSLESIASGLRSMGPHAGQLHLLKLIEDEIKRRREIKP